VVGNYDDGLLLCKVVVCVVVKNLYVGKGFVDDLSVVVEVLKEIGILVGFEVVCLLGVLVESYGKVGFVGMFGE